MSAVDRLAHAAGIEPSYRDYFGNDVRVEEPTKRALLEAMQFTEAGEENVATLGTLVVRHGTTAELLRDAARWSIQLESGEQYAGDPAAVPLGYHRLTLGSDPTEERFWYVVVPAACYVPPEMERGAIWAVATQLYALRSQRNWGAGDFSDLARLARLAGAAGAAAVGLNPLHELHASNPQACSPYAPSSRLGINTFYIDVAAVPELRESARAQALVESPAFAAGLADMRATELVDYPAIARLKREVLELLFAAFQTQHLQRPGDRRAAEFRRFLRHGGEPLRMLATYQALTESFRASDPHSYGWLQWPAEYRSPGSPAVARFAREHAARIEFFAYLQWLADRQLAAAAKAARDCGVGLYRDLAVGVELNGADAWSDQHTIVGSASLGAPPDALNAFGQNWGLPPLSPLALRRSGYAPFAHLLRANMRYAAILRIDHVMSLQRAFWIPRGRPPSEGAYVRYPLQDMLGVLALESVRNRCAIVGEDLGTVPDGFRESMQDARALSSRLVYFERGFTDGVFRAPQTYPRLAASSIGTHDLPPLAGWWVGSDLAVRAQLGLFPDRESERAAREDRRHARLELVGALLASGALDEATAGRLREDASAGGSAAVATELIAATHRFLAQTPSMLKVVAIEDVLGDTEAVNVPGTVDERPNWRRKHIRTLEEIERSQLLPLTGRMFHKGAQ